MESFQKKNHNIQTDFLLSFRYKQTITQPSSQFRFEYFKRTTIKYKWFVPRVKSIFRFGKILNIPGFLWNILSSFQVIFIGLQTFQLSKIGSFLWIFMKNAQCARLLLSKSMKWVFFAILIDLVEFWHRAVSYAWKCASFFFTYCENIQAWINNVYLIIF